MIFAAIMAAAALFGVGFIVVDAYFLVKTGRSVFSANALTAVPPPLPPDLTTATLS
jgi:hypothetical protein